MKSIPQISIVIPTYNYGTTLQACLTSIVNQSFKDFEILLMDGGSTDSTPQICREFSNKYPTINFYSEKDKGIYDAMNKGIRKSVGRWIYFLGADDTLYDDSVLENFIEATNRSKFNFYYANVLVNGDTSWARDQQIYDGFFDISKLLTRNICHQAILYNKTVFQNCGYFNTKYVVCADYDMNLRVASKYPMKHLDFISAVFNPGGASSKVNDHQFMKDLPSNIVRYFFLQIYKTAFKNHEHQIILQAREGDYAFFHKIYLMSVGYYFKIQRKLRLS